MIEILRNKQNTEKIEFIAADGEEKLGSCAGNVVDGVFVFDELNCDDFFADGLVRAILNLMDLQGVTAARFDLPAEKLAVLEKLRFIKDGSTEINSIPEFFSGKCCGCK